MNHLVAISLVLLAVLGCEQSPNPNASADTTSLTFRVTKANEHLGHSTAAEGSSIHPVWCDGCRGRIVGTDEEFVVWWNNNEIKNYPFQFQDGKTYSLLIKEKLDDGVMGYEGKCAHVSQVVKVEEMPKP